MNYKLKRQLLDLVVTYQAMGDEERATLIGNAVNEMKSLEADLKEANEQINLLNGIAIRKQVRKYNEHT